MNVFDHPDFDHHELVAFKDDQASGLKAIIAVHNSTLGPALGGCRMFSYTSNSEALSDVLRLSRGMTYKSALAGIALGGGKSVIIGNPQQDKSRQLLLAMGGFINSLSGTYITAEDSGTGVADMAVMGEKTPYVSGVISGEEHGGDPSPITAYGVYRGVVASVAHKFKSDLKGVRIALQGIGNVGFHLARQLVESGATVYAADINPANIQRAVNQLGVIELPLEDILSADVDVLAPCALGGAININSIESIKAKVIAGAANNQLATADMGDALKQKGILYAPDYVVNAGGIIDVYYQTQGIRDRKKVDAHVERIGDTLKTIFTRADQTGSATSRIADELAEEILAGDVKEMSA
ncbi:MAG: Glu/Leu/Phe/Val dehydrogenase dimerization domain-containing protein [Oceanicoccus sp.]|uniref:Glu/Leu/Phe/Val family dehydrogenase n=1 Tax=Oceanicoccus sp. TaxID=2691044 RepID=UPI002628FBE5|nr:Glu/Leu/Phe/Val dehydrogenase dimerization domain-containing protein [Oceanicoccus sp.]MDG1771944.1 Glu/Leu/Phe/Val dehydrogenase dimerization domain-containing protein [Oceanicoccus sp.]